MANDQNTSYEVQKLVSILSGVERHHYRLNTTQHENDIEHSFSVAMLCWCIIDQHKLPLDMGKTLQYALIHDFPERYAGDVNTFATNDERKQKVINEQVAIDKLSRDFATFPVLISAIKQYDSRSSKEAHFVWTVDKMQALILGDLDNWRPYQELEISFERFSDKYHELCNQASPFCKDIFQALVEHCKTTYYDQPKYPSKQR